MAFLPAVRAQNADLVIGNINFPAASFGKGERISFSYTVKNNGSGPAVKSHTTLYLSSSFSYTGAIQISSVSCKALAAGEESPEIKCAVLLPYALTAGTKYLLLKADANNEVQETNEANDFHSTAPISISAGSIISQNLPYPIIFIHGFISSNTTWDAMKTALQNTYGYSFGGNMNFCLNQDNNTATSNAAADYHDWTNTAVLTAGDFYTVNFDTDPGGNSITSSSVSEALESNQAAVVKQGLAIRDAIKHVLQVTGKTKVILCGHSMGGLSAREYLQNSAIWQSDGAHHVARLVTLGTPHGGTDLTGAGLGGLGGLDEYSEAVRDLRTTYWWSGEPGVYLFGGKEKYNVMQFYPFFNYVNVDVNCNGIDADGSTITGINQKTIPADIGYTCVIGNGSGTGDYVVGIAQANLNNYRQVNADTFMVDVIHTSLTSQVAVNIKALDDSKNASTASKILPGQFYSGLFTQQSLTSPTATDSDYYKFTTTQPGHMRIEVSNMPVQNGFVKIYDQNNVLKYFAATDGAGYADNTSAILPAGTYTVNIAGTPEAGSDASSYSLKTTFLQIVPVSLVNFAAVATANKNVLLSWRTSDESALSDYEIQRSADGNSWSSLFSKQALNNSTNNDYAATDSFPLSDNYYRLKVNDLNGGFTYSAVKSVSFTGSNLVFSISPNPAVNVAVLKFNGPQKDAVLIVLDMQGKEVFKTRINAAEYALNTKTFGAGIYVVRVMTGSENFQQQLIVGK